VAREVTKAANEQWWKPYNGQEIKTQIIEAGPWWDAEEYHQKYLYKNPNGYTCDTHYVRNNGKFGNPLTY
jgi:peptide-methionine (S)-S-oxide reductase